MTQRNCARTEWLQYFAGIIQSLTNDITQGNGNPEDYMIASVKDYFFQ